MKKNVQKILATILTVVMMVSMLPFNVFAADFDADMFVEPAVEAVSVPAEEQEIESAVEEVPVAADEIAEDISVEDAETVNGYAEEFETVDAADPAAADEIEETTEAPVAKTTLEAEGKDYVVSVTYDASALLPDDVKVVVEEIKDTAKKYDDYCDQALEAAQQENADVDELSYVRLFDIKLVDAAGNVLEPASAVDVQIRLKDVETVEDNTQIVHFAGEEEIPEVIEPTVEDDTVSFATDGFSIYAVIGVDEVERLTVNFYGTDTAEPIETMYVKKADQASDEDIEKIVYDPGTGTVPEGCSFYGWSIGVEDYSVETPGKTIEEVRTYIKNLEFDDGAVLNIYAMLVTYYSVHYIDNSEEGKEINLGSDRAMVKAAEKGQAVPYTVNMGYSTDEEHNFEGWLVADGLSNITDPADATTDTLFTNETVIKIKGDVTFSVSAPEGHWLVFDENGKHATYNAPRFIESGEVTSDEGATQSDMIRNGYTFDGWYTEAPSEVGGEPGGTLFEFGQELGESTTIYAKWIPDNEADYVIIIWKENLAGGWDFEESQTFTGTVGDEIAVELIGSGKDIGAKIGGKEYQYKGFNYDHHDENVKVKPEGDAVVNIYYVRNTYTLTFEVGYYNLFDTWRHLRTEDPITAKYGTDISGYFPKDGTIFGDFFSWLDPFNIHDAINSFARWDDVDEIMYHDPLVYIDTMPAADIAFRTNKSVVPRKTMYYYVEALPGQTPARSFDGKDFVLLKGPLYARYDYFTETEDFMDIAGCIKYGSEPKFVNGRIDDQDTLRCYYTRQVKHIIFKDGLYVDGNNYKIDSKTNNTLKTSADIPFGSDISSYNKGGDDYYEPNCPEDGFVFEGWYIDEACTQKYTFDTMSASDITVYAKWRQIQYRVFLRPNAGTDQSLNWGSDNQSMSFRVSYGGKVSGPEGKRNGYKFLGWYRDEGLTKSVYLEGLVLNEDTVTDPYDKTSSKYYTDVMDKWGNGATYNADAVENRFWITKKFELWAKWGRVVYAEGIDVVYDATDDGTNPPRDPLKYQDNTTAIAGAAPTAKAGKVFEKWVVQKYNGTDYVDTSVEIYPGQTFNVSVDDAKIVDIATGNIVSAADTTEGKEYSYTVHVRAEYKDVEEETPTHITWYYNYDDGIYRTDDTGADGDLKINEAVTIYGLADGEHIPERLGYKFLGWAKGVETPVNDDGEPQTDPETGDIVINKTTDETEVFLAYDENSGTYSYDGKEVKKVAADEVLPYEALYAIWEMKPEFYIYHSGTREVDTIDNSTPIEEFDITNYVDDDFIYGGYYRCSVEVADGEVTGVTRGKPYTVNGMKMKPVSGTTYYLKEVDPNTYLVPSVYATWLDPAVSESGALRGLWILTDVDEIEYDDEDTYREFGIDISGKNTANMPFSQSYNTLEVKKNGAAYQTLTTSSIFGADGYFGVANVSEYATLKANQNAVLTLTAYHVTPDNIKVTGTRQKTYNMGNQTLSGVTVSETTIKSKKTQEYLLVATASTAMTYKGTYQIKSEPEIRKYTITKVDDGKNVSQEVEAGNNTGKITYAGKNNYVFAGWYLDKSFTKAADFSEVSGDMTVYAKYVKASAFALSFTKKSSKTGSVTLKATLKITGAPNLADTAVTCGFKGETSSVKFTDVKTTKSGKNTINTHTGTVAISGLANKNSFTAVISYRTPDGTTVSLAEKTCKYVSGAVTVK